MIKGISEAINRNKTQYYMLKCDMNKYNNKCLVEYFTVANKFLSGKDHRFSIK